MEIISFVTLFLGLVTGEQPVEVLVGDHVSRVEIVLDGQTIGTLTGEPWRLSCDLGPELVPHELVAVAHDDDNRELGRATQWINLARALAEASLVVDGDRSSGLGRTTRLSWRCVYTDDPPRISLSMDGRPIPVADPQRIELPAFNPHIPHFLQAELEFSGGTVATANLGIGGFFAGASETRLTAIPLELTRRSLPEPDEMAGWFQVGSQALQVIAVESTTSDLVMVVSPAALQDLYRFAGPRTPSSSGHRRRLPDSARLRLVWPVAETRSSAGEELGLFSPSRLFSSDEAPLLTLMKSARPVDPPDGPIRLADAVAVAGRLAAAAGHRRAVILVISDEQEDASIFSAETVRHYLASLHVPLVVWFAGSSGSLHSGWGQARRISSEKKFDSAVIKLTSLLSDQHVVWLDSALLPQRVTLSTESRGVRLLASPAAPDTR